MEIYKTPTNKYERIKYFYGLCVGWKFQIQRHQPIHATQYFFPRLTLPELGIP